MRREEAEREAQRRNLEDERRERYVYYAFDESAGLGDDAWQVAARLRRANEAPAAAPEELVAAAQPGAPGPEPAPAAGPAVAAAPAAYAPPAQPTEAYDVLADEPEAGEERAQPVRAGAGRMLRAWAAFVTLVGAALIVLALLLAFVFSPDIPAPALVYVVALALGAFTFWLGRAIARA
jgi:hypothetical protein